MTDDEPTFVPVRRLIEAIVREDNAAIVELRDEPRDWWPHAFTLAHLVLDLYSGENPNARNLVTRIIEDASS